MKKFGNIVMNSAILLFFIGNGYYIFLQYRERTAFDLIPTQRPTLLLIINDQECASCIKSLQSLNEIVPVIQNEHGFDISGLMLSKGKEDANGLTKAFDFPFLVTDNFGIAKRLNANHTPLLIALSAEKEVLFVDLLPFGSELDTNFVLDTILDRLHYSLEF